VPHPRGVFEGAVFDFSPAAAGTHFSLGGNMTQDGSGLTYSFHAENRPTLASGTPGGPYCYVYDGNSLRVAKKSSASFCSSGAVAKIYWRFLSGDALAETDGSGSTTNSAYHEYVFFAGRRMRAIDLPFSDPDHFQMVRTRLSSRPTNSLLVRSTVR